ncbi:MULTISPECIES: peptidoglycan editing factor PgeF [Rickettsieae]|uniref:peptidoglycan editing factor PgeF n=1 Tax=Rickettsieae TaxID=33988 RepID=UPI000B9C2BCA|nr:peptidoglycan editing factor PgeF [Rickettsia endosymbiont of Culicoides newsteadi]OZG31429.1 laccase [Rickettsia endosymbiont of Culicoides newsteadi]
MHQLVKNKVYYKIFDKSFKQSSHVYSKKNKSGVSNNLEIVQNNRLAVVQHYNADNIIILQQMHGTKVIDADLDIDTDTDIEADGAVTTKKNLVLAIQSADCVPVLFSSEDGMVIGTAHCGWRGAKAGIINNVVKLMHNKGAKNIKAIICPSIQQCSYEVDQEYYDNFIKQRADYSKFFINSLKIGYYMFDLPAYVELQLQEAGVKDITRILEDTYSNPEKYISYRRCCHTGELYNHTILSTIVICN